MRTKIPFQKFYFLVPVFVLIAHTSFGQRPLQKTSQTIAFIENKGQVHDQNGKVREDILYSGMAGPLYFHLSSTGINYQLVKSEAPTKTSKNIFRPGLDHPENEETTIYRVDMEWVNVDPKARVEPIQVLPGLQHYYGGSDERGITDVRSFSGLKYSGIYPGIDLHYYGNEAGLKYDYVVAPFASYKQISILVHGAEITPQSDGSLLLKTPLGDIVEGAPVVYQEGKKITARWSVKGSSISFVLGDYDQSKSLVIDPPVRSWSTYFGTSAREDFRDCATDESGNVYICGAGYPAASMATSGAHQTTYSGSTGIIAKFDPDGNRIWCTYYGSFSGSYYGLYLQAIKGDKKGNVYVGGSVHSSSSGSLSLVTAGCHQSSPGGGGGDCLLIKLSTGGTRQWATFYGGGGDDRISDCATDTSGNIYFSGTTYSSSVSNSTVMTTAGAFQTQATNAAFLVKFNPNGVRLWGTFYGGCDWTHGGHCATDKAGNVILVGNAGYTSTPNCSVTITSPGAFQTAHTNTTSTDGFVAKFDAGGSRLWGTLFGSTGDDSFGDVATDPGGNIYVTGLTSSTNNIATSSAHQTVFGGGQFSLTYPIGGYGDAVIAKFSSSGARVWATYYGGQREDYGTTIDVDSLSNVYVAGLTATYNGSVFSSPGAFQPGYAGAESDYFIAKFDSSGQRHWGTYYGTPYGDYYFYLGLAIKNGVYLCGTIQNTSTAFGSPGAYQTMGAGDYDGFLSKFESCTISTLAATGFPSQTCAGQSFSVTPSGAYSFTVNPGNYALPAVIVHTAATVYTLTGAVSGCTNTSSRTYSVGGTALVVSVSGGAVCAGQSFTINPSGANSFSYSSGNNVVTPGSTTTYSVWGISQSSCVSNAVPITVTVNMLPVLSFPGNAPAICAGSSYTISPSGASTYIYSSGSNVVTPGVTTTYSVWGTSLAGCMSNAATLNVVVNTLPVLSMPGSGAVCAGDSYTIVPSGAYTYSYSSGINVVSPVSTTTYSVWGTSQAGCVSNPVTVNVVVNAIPVVSLPSSTSLCLGSSYSINPSGASTYTYSSGTNFVSPSVTTTYSVWGTSQSGCISNAAVLTIIINAPPVISIASSSAIICAGSPATLTASGAQNYAWNNGPSSSTFVVSPVVTTMYVVQGAQNGCSAQTYFVQNVIICDGVGLSEAGKASFNIFPNPTNGNIVIEAPGYCNCTFELYSSSGQLIMSEALNAGTSTHNFGRLASGMYSYVLRSSSNNITGKLLVQ